MELRPIAITQPPVGRVVEVLLQVEGFEPEAASCCGHSCARNSWVVLGASLCHPEWSEIILLKMTSFKSFQNLLCISVYSFDSFRGITSRV